MIEIQMPKANGREMTQERLSEVFDLVKPLPNWKMPIDAAVAKDKATEEEISAAVIWFTGSLPTIYAQDAQFLRVTASGYYNAIGA